MQTITYIVISPLRSITSRHLMTIKSGCPLAYWKYSYFRTSIVASLYPSTLPHTHFHILSTTRLPPVTPESIKIFTHLVSRHTSLSRLSHTSRRPTYTTSSSPQPYNTSLNPPHEPLRSGHDAYSIATILSLLLLWLLLSPLDSTWSHHPRSPSSHRVQKTHIQPLFQL